MPSRCPFTFSRSLHLAVNPIVRSSNILASTYRQPPFHIHPALQSYSLRYYAFGSPRRPQYNRFNRARVLFHTSTAFRYTTLGAASCFAIFIVSNIEQVPESGRWRFNCVSEDFERRNGDATYRMVMEQYRRQFIRSSDQRCRMVGRVLQRLVEGGNLKGDWEYHVIQGEEKNAFVVPGGKVFVFSGILPVCESDAGLATVLSHEIAHNMVHHVQERLSIPYLLQPIAWVASLLLGDTGGIANIFLGLTFQLPNSRAQEAEADRLGLSLMAQSCYDPEEAGRFWTRMEKAEKFAPPQFLSTHPASRNRIEKMREWLPEAKQVQALSNCWGTTQQINQFRQTYPPYTGSSNDQDDNFW